MKLSGDVPLEHKVAAKELEDMENLVSSDPTFPKEVLAKIYTCLAHDWYQMDVEEEGSRLLLAAERVCPGYFKTTMIQHIQEDSDFDKVIKNLSTELVWMLVNRINEKVT